MKSTIQYLLLTVAAMALLSAGCATPCKVQNMVTQNPLQAGSAHDSVIVTVDSTVPKRNLLVGRNFSEALVESLRKTGLFKSVESSGNAPFPTSNDD
ncbi:MAG: hypothetical protein ACREDS_11760 [Limisphaerales bacterium]